MAGPTCPGKAERLRRGWSRAECGLEDAGDHVVSELATNGPGGSVVLSEGPADGSLWSTCRLFGDESDLHFWTVASHYLQSFAQARQLSVATAEGQTQSEAAQPAAADHNHLDICNDVLCESSYFQVSGRRRWRPESRFSPHLPTFAPFI